MSAKQTLQTVFGYDSFRPFQEDIINRSIQGSDSIVIMPTEEVTSAIKSLPLIETDAPLLFLL